MSDSGTGLFCSGSATGVFFIVIGKSFFPRNRSWVARSTVATLAQGEQRLGCIVNAPCTRIRNVRGERVPQQDAALLNDNCVSPDRLGME